jgi:hypothetical protein
MQPGCNSFIEDLDISNNPWISIESVLDLFDSSVSYQSLRIKPGKLDVRGIQSMDTTRIWTLLSSSKYKLDVKRIRGILTQPMNDPQASNRYVPQLQKPNVTTLIPFERYEYIGKVSLMTRSYWRLCCNIV